MDISKRLKEQVETAAAEKWPLNVCGGNSQSFLVPSRVGSELSLLEHGGVIDYQATELTLQVRAGTSMAEVNALLAEKGQMLPFESAEAEGKATVGGAVATALAGPRSGFAGGVSDFVLGATLLNGKGEILEFGGQVMKNVAGFDVSRYLCGTFGCSGVLLDISFKVLPKPYQEQTYCLSMPATKVANFLHAMNDRPLSASCWYQDELFIRIANGNSEFTQTLRVEWGAKEFENGEQLWSGIRERNTSFFVEEEMAVSENNRDSKDGLLMCSVPAHCELSNALLEANPLMERNGTRYWFKATAVEIEKLEDEVSAVGGFVMIFPNRNSLNEASLNTIESKAQHQAPLLRHENQSLKALQQRIRHAFDPNCLFNRGQQLMPWLES